MENKSWILFIVSVFILVGYVIPAISIESKWESIKETYLHLISSIIINDDHLKNIIFMQCYGYYYGC